MARGGGGRVPEAVQELAGYSDTGRDLMLPSVAGEGGADVRAETLPDARFGLVVDRTMFTGFY